MRTAKSFGEKDAAWGVVGTGLSFPYRSPQGPASRGLQGPCPPGHFCLPHGPAGSPFLCVPSKATPAADLC